jgi:hypothetical protein
MESWKAAAALAKDSLGSRMVVPDADTMGMGMGVDGNGEFIIAVAMVGEDDGSAAVGELLEELAAVGVTPGMISTFLRVWMGSREKLAIEPPFLPDRLLEFGMLASLVEDIGVGDSAEEGEVNMVMDSC